MSRWPVASRAWRSERSRSADRRYRLAGEMLSPRAIARPPATVAQRRRQTPAPLQGRRSSRGQSSSEWIWHVRGDSLPVPLAGELAVWRGSRTVLGDERRLSSVFGALLGQDGLPLLDVLSAQQLTSGNMQPSLKLSR